MIISSENITFCVINISSAYTVICKYSISINRSYNISIRTKYDHFLKVQLSLQSNHLNGRLILYDQPNLIIIFYAYTLIFTSIFIILNKDISFQNSKMDITLDFTQQPKPKLSDVSEHPYLRSITFVLPFFQQSKNNFACLWEYITFLNDKPLVKIFVNPKGEEIKPKYQVVAVGGTFDHLHIGHQVLLLHAVLSTEKKLIIGMTSEPMLQHKVNKQLIQSLLMRINEVREFIRHIKPDLQLQFEQLQDPYGPTIDDENIDAIAVSPQTQKTAQTINQKRKQKGYHPLVVQKCPILAPVHHLTSIKSIQNKISSTQIRAHLLAKNGLTVEKFVNYQEEWKAMVERIHKVTGKQTNKNTLVSMKWWDIVVKYYSQYWRYFHTNHHLAVIFRELKETPQMGFDKLTQTQKIALQISIFFHDIIYRPDLKTNEQDSVNFAFAFIKEIWGDDNEAERQEVKDRVKSAILSTKTHKPTLQLQKILCDLDMAILDSPLDKYQTYAFNIEREYRPLFKEGYPKGRIEFLSTYTQGYKYSFRKGARVEDNIKWEIEHWRQQLPKEE